MSKDFNLIMENWRKFSGTKKYFSDKPYDLHNNAVLQERRIKLILKEEKFKRQTETRIRANQETLFHTYMQERMMQHAAQSVFQGLFEAEGDTSPDVEAVSLPGIEIKTTAKQVAQIKMNVGRLYDLYDKGSDEVMAQIEQIAASQENIEKIVRELINQGDKSSAIIRALEYASGKAPTKERIPEVKAIVAEATKEVQQLEKAIKTAAKVALQPQQAEQFQAMSDNASLLGSLKLIRQLTRTAMTGAFLTLGAKFVLNPWGELLTAAKQQLIKLAVLIKELTKAAASSPAAAVKNAAKGIWNSIVDLIGRGTKADYTDMPWWPALKSSFFALYNYISSLSLATQILIYGAPLLGIVTALYSYFSKQRLGSLGLLKDVYEMLASALGRAKAALIHLFSGTRKALDKAKKDVDEIDKGKNLKESLIVDDAFIKEYKEVSFGDSTGKEIFENMCFLEMLCNPAKFHELYLTENQNFQIVNENCT